MISSETIEGYLARLAARQPTPGGGAAGALHAAQGAALIAMVARYTTGAKYADHAEDVERIIAGADAVIPVAVRTANADEEAFAAVIKAYGLPADSEDNRALRTRAIQDALAQATEPPRDLINLAGQIIDLGHELAEFGNANVISDVAAASEAARAAIATAMITLEINIKAIKDAELQDALRADVLRAEQIIASADDLSSRVRKRVLA
ncbi:cyclodeaminase/cyclohydrolase family protein [Arthrobacter mobilis]|uniref:Cyclodeaminase/cyclohydrolase family protein n=1 Tax=Arthrobacter mobilis TaxID=2724944 RepID=A0A7X6QMU2_9MICC|nr:cyclodeaminase/cyclohydrolase family protein [Arthrobacter mobilis]NKX56795.1 cyclodeaminase/cyclohydrolase family protein [Arthrobacter mobilis]